MDKYDGVRLAKCFDDEFGFIRRGKEIKLGKVFYLYSERYLFYFRLFGYGLHARSLKKRWFMLFSERNGYDKSVKFMGWKWKLLKPFK